MSTNAEQRLQQQVDELLIKLAASEEARKIAEADRDSESRWASEYLQRAEAAEKLLEDSRKQEPVVQRMMSRLAELLDEDKFAEMEGLANDAGIFPPPIPPELSEVMRERDELKKDAERLSWLEDQYGLHEEPEITNVVDGYEIEFTYDGNPTDGKTYHGENLREAIDKAMLSASPTYKE